MRFDISSLSLSLSLSNRKHALKILCALEGVLLVIVCAGFLDFKFQHTIPTPVKNLHYSTQPKLKGWDDERLRRKPHETDMEYATRMNVVVGSAFYHCDYRTKENIFEKVASRFSKTYEQVGFLQPTRNCGFCHQAAYILARVLDAHGIEAVPLGMNGHVCVLMKDGSHDYIFDPDYAVGPMLYLDDMTPYIAELYGTDPFYEPVYKPFATNKDDKPYFSMKWLNEAQAEQDRILWIVKGLYYLCFVLLVLNTLLIIMTLRRGRR
ncbi:MAG: hypothetical protein K2J64_01785 [Desulfovibrio sp.]|nr:hypothetical protein [Desulfovibrio sp.]